MAHLINYEEAEGPKAKALAAIEVSKRKNAKYLAWIWAEKAINHAKEIGITGISLGDGRYPNTDTLEESLK